MSQLLSRREIVDGPANEDESALRIWYAHCRLPRPTGCTRDPRRVFGSNPKQEMTSADERICGPAKELFELTDRSASDEVRKNRLRANFLKSLGADFHIGKSEGPYHLG